MFAAALISCSSRPPEEPAIGAAYVGPAQLILRTDLTVRSPARITVSHGDRVDILETRRRFVRVRTAQGTEGWTDANNLLSAEQMDDLSRVGEDAKKLPSQGRATVFDQLNVHIESSRQSPSFFQIAEGGSVDVIGHRVAPRNQPASRLALPAVNPTQPSKKAKSRAPRVVSLLSPPSPPPPPADWLDRSRPRAADLPGYKAPAPSTPAPMDDWSLVRAADGKAGWVLSRMLFMAVPDEVAQYAEGHRITAYMALDDLTDGGEHKPSWLWTTAAPGLREAEFDSFRVFVWNTRRHRYETGHVERNLTGYYPVETVQVPGKQEKGFSLIVTEKDGHVSKRTYSFAGRRVKLISKVPYQLPPETLRSEGGKPVGGSTPDAGPPKGWWQRVTSFVRKR